MRMMVLEIVATHRHLVPSSNVNQPKANSTQEGVKSIVAQTEKTRKRKPKMDKSTFGQTAVQASLVTEKVGKPVCQHKVSPRLLAVLIAIALALLISIFRIADRTETSIMDT